LDLLSTIHIKSGTSELEIRRRQCFFSVHDFGAVNAVVAAADGKQSEQNGKVRGCVKCWRRRRHFSRTFPSDIARGSTLEQSTCWRPVCLVTHNISSKAENSFISAILPRHCFI